MQHFLYSVPALFVGIQASSPLEMAKFATEEHPNLNSFFPFRSSHPPPLVVSHVARSER